MRKKVWRIAAIVFVMMISMVSVIGCNQRNEEQVTGEKEESSDLITIRAGSMPYYASVPLQVIKDEKLDEKYGFKLEILSFPSGGPMADALGAGEWDVGPIGAGGMVAVPYYNAKLNADVELEMDGAWIIARPDSDIVKAGNTLKEYPDVIGSTETVRGKTFLGTVGNISQYMALNYASLFDLSGTDINFMNMETANVYTAFVSGNGYLACIGSPSAGQKLLDEGYVLVGGLKQQGRAQQDSILVSNDFYENNREDTVNFMKAWLTATEMLNSDPEYEIEMVTKFYTESGRTDFTEKDVIEECGWNEFIDKDNYTERPMGQWMSDLVDFMVEEGTMEKEASEAMRENIKDDIIIEAVDALKQE